MPDLKGRATDNGSFRRRGVTAALRACGAAAALVFAASAGAAEASRVLVGGKAGLGVADARADGVALGRAEERLRIDVPVGERGGARRRVVFPLSRADGDLSRFRHVELELANVGAAPVVFTFWALAGPGWGGASTYSTSQNTSGREALAPGARETFRVDLHAVYPGARPMRTIDPAAVRELELVFEPARAPAAVMVLEIRATGVAGPPEMNAARIRVPAIERRDPAPGRRVFQTLPGWERTDIAHVLTLPREWRRGVRFPVIVEYTGNVFYHKYCHSTGHTEQGNLAYGLSRGEGFICLNLPFVSEDGRREQVDGWGDIARTEEYCLEALRFVEERYGGDSRAVYFTGFSRGSYAANYLALRDDRIAAVWAGFLTLHNPGAAWPQLDQRGWKGVDVGWNERAARMNGRPWFHVRDEFGADVHVDVEFMDNAPPAVATRERLAEWLRRARP